MRRLSLAASLTCAALFTCMSLLFRCPAVSFYLAGKELLIPCERTLLVG